MNLDEAIAAAASQGGGDGGGQDGGSPVDTGPAVPAPDKGVDGTRAAPVVEAKADPASGPARGPDGKFAPKPKEVAAAEPSPGAVPPLGAGAQPVAAKPPPPSWTPDEREAWAGLSPAAQAAILRREEDADRLSKDHSSARSVLERLEKSVSPYRDLLDPKDPFSTIADLLHTRKQLQYGAGPQKQGLLLEMAKAFGVPIDAAFAAGLINNHKLDVEAINAQMSGGGQPTHHAPQSPDAIRAMIQEEAKTQARTYVEEMQREQRNQAAQAQVEAFKAKHEYFNDLEPSMIGLVRGGVCKTPEDAYATALLLPANANIKRLVDQKAAAAAVGAQAPRVASPRPEPAAGPRVKNGAPMTLDDAIAAAYNQAS